MKKLLVCLLLVGFVSPFAYAEAILDVVDGGTGNSTLETGTFLLGNSTSPIIASSSPTILRNFIDNYVYNVIGNTNDILFNNGGSFGTDDKFRFYPYKVHVGTAGPTLELGTSSTAALKFVAYEPDPTLVIFTNDAQSGSNANGPQLAIGSGAGDGTGKGGTLWLVSGGGDTGGDILISAKNNASNAGQISITSGEGGITVGDGGANIAGTDGTHLNVGEEIGINGSLRFTYADCIYNHDRCLIKLSGGTPVVGDGSSDCGTSPVIDGNDNAGRITVGSDTNGGKCTVTFISEWSNPPICIVQSETDSVSVRPNNVTASSFEIVGSLTEDDSLVYQCAGY